MEKDWVITPPTSPVMERPHPSMELKKEEEYIIHEERKWFRCFNCMGQFNSHQCGVYHPDGYVMNGEIGEILNGSAYPPLNSKIILFQKKFDRKSAFFLDRGYLFKMAEYCLIRLGNAVRMADCKQRCLDYRQMRKVLVEFLLYCRDILRKSEIDGNKEADFISELASFKGVLGTLDQLPEAVLTCGADNRGNECDKPAYSLFHSHLDAKWLLLTVSYHLNVKAVGVTHKFPNAESFENDLIGIVSELIVIAVFRFKSAVSDEALFKINPFSCTCIQEFWKLLQELADSISEEKCFWYFLNKILNPFLNVAIIAERNVTCANPTLFVLWLLKNISHLYNYKYQSDLSFDVNKSNHELLENVVKKTLGSNITEKRLRIHFLWVENILNDWEAKTDTLLLFWEYFQSRLNSLFLVGDGPIGNIAIISKSALGWLTRVHSRLDDEKSDMSNDSFHLFLRILGRNLRKWKSMPRFWNQIKGRIFSKFSPGKMASLNETGLHRFFSLFLTLAVSADLNEVLSKFQTFLKCLPPRELDASKLELILKGHGAFILLHAQRNVDISVSSAPFLDIVDAVVASQCQPDCLPLMRIFVETFQDLIDCNGNLELGQYSYIDSWIKHYMNDSGESEVSRLLDLFLTILNKLNTSPRVQESMEQDCQLMLLQEALWLHMAPEIQKKMTLFTSPYQVADVAAALTILSFQPAFYSSSKTRSVNFFNSCITSDNVDARLLCRYLGQLSPHLSNSPLSTNILLLIKGWLRCCILTSDEKCQDENLKKYTDFVANIPEIRSLSSFDFNVSNDVFFTFLNALQSKYSALTDLRMKSKFVEQVSVYFSNCDKWLHHYVKVPKSSKITVRIYKNVGILLKKIPWLLYTKSKPNTVLKNLMDLLLLPAHIYNPQHKIHPCIKEAVRENLHLYVDTLVLLGPENDAYISRALHELIANYVPRLVAPRTAFNTGQFSLVKCFGNGGRTGKFVLDVLCRSFIKQKSRVPHQFAHQALIFINSVARSYASDNSVVECLVSNVLEKLCDVVIYCEEGSPCKREAKDIVKYLLDLHTLRVIPEFGDAVMKIFAKLSYENLAFSARLLFDLLEDLINVAPDLISRFLPQLMDQVQQVERKRGVGYDKALRKGVEKLEENLKKLKN